MFSIHKMKHEKFFCTKRLRALCFETLKNSEGETFNCLTIQWMIFEGSLQMFSRTNMEPDADSAF
jgi:hypothetical protein